MLGGVDGIVAQSVPLLSTRTSGLVVALVDAVATAGHVAKAGLCGLGTLGGRTKPSTVSQRGGREGGGAGSLHAVRAAHALGFDSHAAAIDNLSPAAGDDAGLVGLRGLWEAAGDGGAGSLQLLLGILVVILGPPACLGGLGNSLGVLLLLHGSLR